jgi:hypothetical protein
VYRAWDLAGKALLPELVENVLSCFVTNFPNRLALNHQPQFRFAPRMNASFLAQCDLGDVEQLEIKGDK